LDIPGQQGEVKGVDGRERERYQCVMPGIILVSMSDWIVAQSSPSSGAEEGRILRRLPGSTLETTSRWAIVSK